MLEQVSFNNKSIKARTKNLLFNAYLRPVINYGFDILQLTANDVGTISKLEGNIVKDSFGLLRRTRSTELFLALKLLPSIEMLKKNKLSLFLRLIANEFTNKVLENLLLESNVVEIQDSLVNDIIEIIKEYDENFTEITMESLKRACSFSI